MLLLTDAALGAVRQVLAEAGYDQGGLRVAIENMGCSGLNYRLVLEEAPLAADEVVELDGLDVFVDPASRPLLEGVLIDFVENEEGAGFVFDNPNAKGGCACGKPSC